MRLSHTRKALTISALLIMTGLLGQAAAAQTTSPHTSPQAVAPPSAAVTTASAPASPSPAITKSHAPAPKPDTDRVEKATANKHVRTGPAGSRLTTGTKGVALTFDDGPDPQYTPQLLRMLAKEKVKATFCVVGRQAKRHPQLIRDIVKAGHTLCNHSWIHDLKLGKKPAAKIKADLERTNAAILAAAPKAKIRFMRAPGGNFTPTLVSTARQMGMTSIYWKVDPRDWDHAKNETHGQHCNKIIRLVKRHTRPGAIVLSHDYAQPDTIKAYRTLLPWLHHRFRLVAL
ncbi:polysaccharide deacetylase family protein [Actinoplanes sp. GCM10030250]|uniref:polysaccharide deacetylase family protein n=1 Tax=Actinoplanes sp. GCM10030250 TaxID=3273376 RepID=UPI00360869F4